VSEKRRLRELEHELRNPGKLFDADLFLAQLKQPRPIISSTGALVSERESLKEIIDGLNYVPKVLMDVERFFREDLAAKTQQADIEKDVPQLVNKINELTKEATQAWEAVVDVLSMLSHPSSFLHQLLLLKLTEGEGGNENISDILLTLSELLSKTKSLLAEFENYLIVSHNLFSNTALPLVFPTEGIPSKTGEELIRNMEKDLVPWASRYIEELGFAVLDPRTANIRLGNTKVLDILRKIRDVYENASKKFEPLMGEKAVSDFIDTIILLNDSLAGMLLDGSGLVYDCLALRYLLEKLTGYRAPSSRCSFFLEPPPSEIPEELTFTLFFNDIAYIVHRAAEMAVHLSNYIAEKLGMKNASEFRLDRCNIPVYSSVESGPLFNFAVAWLNTVCQLASHGWVTPDDLSPLVGYIISDTEAWFRVGSAAMHATHVIREDNTWVIRYHDTDEPVNTLMAKLWGSVPNTEVEVLDDGVLVKTKGEKALPFLGALLGFATSMDINLEYLGGNIRDRMIKLAEKVSPQLSLIVKKALGA
jgi:hypothetical protein